MTFLFIAIFEDSQSAAPQAEAAAVPHAQAQDAAAPLPIRPSRVSSPAKTDTPDGRVGCPSPSGPILKPLSKADQIRLLRPNCLNVEVCAGSGRNHCHSCTKAMGEAA